MASNSLSVDEAFWRFSLDVYASPGVADRCLALQDRLGLDVNLLLFCCFCAVRERVIDGQDARALDRAVASWRSRVIRPLRGVRRASKAAESGGVAGGADVVKALLAVELETERVEQRILAARLAGLGVAADDPLVVAAGNLGAYLSVQGKAFDAETRRDLSVLLAAAFGIEPSAGEQALVRQGR